MTALPLDGVRVVDLGHECSALATRILADLGADVVLVEPAQGARVRHRAPYLDGAPGPEHGFQHLYLDANKRSAVLDPDELDRLLERADVLVETPAPGDPLPARRPGLIHAVVTPFGVDARWSSRKANDLVAGAAGGLIWVCGTPGEPPVQGAARPSYTMGSLVAAAGVMVALAAREREGTSGGLTLDVSLQESTAMAVLQTANPSFWAWHGRSPGRPGLSSALQVADGEWVAFTPRPDRFEAFRSWARDVGVSTKLEPDDWPHARIGAPPKNNPVVAATKELAAKLGREDFIDGAGAADMMCMPVSTFPYMDGHPHFAANEQFFEVEHAPLGRTLGFVRSPVDAMEAPIEVRRAPLLGEHTSDVRTVFSEPARTTDAAAPDPYRALEGVRVIDFCWVLAGPLTTRLLASFGAEVIRVESSRARRDSMRDGPGPDGKPDTEMGALFNDANAGKRSVTLDLSDERGRDVARRLIESADVVTNNFRPGALDRMGLGYGVMRAANSRVIYLGLPGTHSRGPWATRQTLGNLVMGASGFSRLMGFEGQRPRGIGVAYPDFTSPYLGAICVMAALRERARTGLGQELDLSQLGALVSLLGAEWMQYRATGTQPPRGANRDPNYAPHGVYPCEGEDRWVAIAVENDAEFAALADAIGQPDMAGDARFATHAARKQHEDDLDARLSAWTREREAWSIADALQAAGVAAAPVERLEETYTRDPQLRDHYVNVHQPKAADVDIPVDRDAVRFRGLDQRLRRGPALGEHTESVLRDVLGLSAEDYRALLDAGVLT